MLTLFSFVIFFAYAALVAITFYKTYNQVSLRMMRMSIGNVREFVHWMQVCCDYIVLFGICSVAITAMFPTDAWPYTVLLMAGAGMFTYIAYSLHQYGKVVGRASRAAKDVAQSNQ
jgi:protein-S-isoprenylcysteine O-methyltransferase Ste14